MPFLYRLFWPRLGPIIVALLLFAGIVVFLNHLLRIETLEGVSERYVLAHERDDHGHIMHAVANLSVDRPLLLLIGGSTMREGFIASALLQRQLKAEGVVRNVVNLSSFDQSLAETRAILATIVERGMLKSGDTVVLGMNPNRLSKADDFGFPLERLPLLTADMAPLLQPAIWRAKTAFWAWVEGHLTPRLLEAGAKIHRLECGSDCLGDLVAGEWFRWPRRYLPFAYPDNELPQDVREGMAEEIRRLRVPDFRLNHEREAARLRSIVGMLQSVKVQVALINLPRSEMSYRAYASVEVVYLDHMRRLADSDAVFIDLAVDADLTNVTYYDLEHIRAASRPAVTNRLVERLLKAGML